MISWRFSPRLSGIFTKRKFSRLLLGFFQSRFKLLVLRCSVLRSPFKQSLNLTIIPRALTHEYKQQTTNISQLLEVEQNTDLSVASRSIICRSRRLRQIIVLLDTDKSRYFAITEFNNYFIFLAAQESDLPFFSPITHEQNIICSKTRLDGTTHEQTISCRQLFAGHVVGSRPMERKKKSASNDNFNYVVCGY